MYQQVNFSMFCDAFRSMGREDQFSHDGKRALFDWLDEIGDGAGGQCELDVIGLCCDFTEYKDSEEAASDIGCSVDDIEDATIAEFDGGIIVQAF